MSYFPMYIELKNEDCLVVGGGHIALRKVQVLMDFGARVSVVAPKILSEIRQIDGLSYLEKEFERSDVMNRKLVVAATDDKQLNHQIGQICMQHNIPVNAVDQIEDCSFIFPAYIRKGEVVAAFSSGGQSPVIAQYLKEQARPVMTEHLGELAACLGGLRDQVKECVETEAARKSVYVELLRMGLSSERIPTENEIAAMIEKYRKGKKENGTDEKIEDK